MTPTTNFIISVQLSLIILISSKLLVESSPVSLKKLETEQQETINGLKNFGFDDDIAYFRQEERDESEEKVESTTPFTVTFTTPRIFDYANGLNGILSGVSSLNLDKILAGSFQFIPKTVRGGVQNILSSIVGRPVANDGYFTKATTPTSAPRTTPSTSTTKKPKQTTTTTEAIEAEVENNNAEEEVDDFEQK